MSELYHITERDETIQNTMFRRIQKKVLALNFFS